MDRGIKIPWVGVNIPWIGVGYTPYAGVAGMLLHVNGKFTMEKLKSSLIS
jgi:hypothetical protein